MRYILFECGYRLPRKVRERRWHAGFKDEQEALAVLQQCYRSIFTTWSRGVLQPLSDTSSDILSIVYLFVLVTVCVLESVCMSYPLLEIFPLFPHSTEYVGPMSGSDGSHCIISMAEGRFYMCNQLLHPPISVSMCNIYIYIHYPLL